MAASMQQNYSSVPLAPSCGGLPILVKLLATGINSILKNYMYRMYLCTRVVPCPLLIWIVSAVRHSPELPFRALPFCPHFDSIEQKAKCSEMETTADVLLVHV